MEQVPSNIPTTASAWVDPLRRFLDYLRVERNASKHTLSGYERDIRSFFGWFEETAKRPAGLDDVTIASMRRFLAFRQGDLERSSVARGLSAMRSFYRFLLKRGEVKESTPALIQSPKQKKPLASFLTAEEARELVEPEAAEESPESLRDLAMWEVMYGAGLRVSELVGLSLGDLSVQEGWVRVLGKGRKEREVPVGSKAIEAVQRYLAVRHLLLREGLLERALFVNSRGGAASKLPGPGAVAGWAIGAFDGCSMRRRRGPGRYAACRRTVCATALRPTCWRGAPTCAPSRRCWVMRAFGRRSGTPM